MNKTKIRSFDATVDLIRNYAIFTLDLDGKITSWNVGAEQIIGWKEEEVLGTYYDFLYRDEEKKHAESRLKDVLENGSSQELSLIPRKNGALFLADLSISRINDTKSRKHIGYIQVIKDETVQHDKENRQLNENNILKAEVERRKIIEKALVESNRELEAFASAASHDLQEPLRMVVSYLELLKRRYRNSIDRDGQEFMDFAIDGATRMKNLISDLVDYARVGTNSKQLKPTSTDEVVTSVLTDLETVIADSGAKVTKTRLPDVIGDDVQLRQLFQNLISNAIKFADDKPEIKISAVLKNKEYVFSVADNGPGIDLKYHESIFLIFKQLNKRAQKSGSGIGLATAKKIVKKHGGKIWVESSPGKGSTFYFTLPGIMRKDTK